MTNRKPKTRGFFARAVPERLTAKKIIEDLYANNYGDYVAEAMRKAQAGHEKINRRVGAIQSRAASVSAKQSDLVDRAEHAEPGAMAELAAEYARLEGERAFYDKVLYPLRLEYTEARRRLDAASVQMARVNNVDSRKALADRLRGIIASYAPISDPVEGGQAAQLPIRELNKLTAELDKLTKPIEVEVWPPPKSKAEARRREQQREQEEQAAFLAEQAEALRREISGQSEAAL